MAHLTLYMDETGSRHPDKVSGLPKGRDWFALGGILVENEKKQTIQQMRDDMAAKWNITAPFHMTDMINERKKFSWLGRLSQTDRDLFWSQYRAYLASLPVLGVGCVIDRGGYVARGYLKKHPDKWLLCRSAFDILVERSVKYAVSVGRKLEIIFESDPGINRIIEGYYENLKENGLAFDQKNSDKYKPLSAADFKENLTHIENRPKSNRILQVADSYVYCVARSGYDKKYEVYRRLRDAKRIINFTLANDEDILAMGIKYYCFDR
ncbi:DUF3800 domain-containing protein [Mesorhizobium abyssinicae]|uniref:DUF3800 domain-containing protein n=1 Tax=Mesorhizobium abyssinicae TaxID=1209958 RepID=UPI002A248D91|nr:DUF3800 domain-containing protein [Mesorhizobium abyssinicae]MDX8437177.1 DUF3800 domain-containing protein [Mesorhizobium abyssinicae]